MSQKAKEKADLLAKLPASAKRVKVKTAKGETKYRDLPHGVLDTDDVVLNVKGKPIIMRSSPGRKAKADPQPVTDTVKELVRRKNAAIADDSLRQTTKSDPDSDLVLQEVMLGLTEEVASLRFEREEAERLGKETSQISVRRIGGLKATAETWLKRKDQLVNKSIDPNSPGFKAAAGFILQTMKEAMLVSGLRPEMVQTVYAKFSNLTSAQSWESELKAHIKNSM